VDGALSRLSYTHKGAMTNIIVGKEGNQAKYNRELVETDWCKNPDQFTPYNWGRSFQDEDAYAKDKEKITDVAVANQLKEGGVAGVPIPNANAELGGAELDRGCLHQRTWLDDTGDRRLDRTLVVAVQEPGRDSGNKLGIRENHFHPCCERKAGVQMQIQNTRGDSNKPGSRSGSEALRCGGCRHDWLVGSAR